MSASPMWLQIWASLLVLHYTVHQSYGSDCGGVLTDERGSLEVVGSNSDVTINSTVDCRWTFVAEQNRTIHFFITGLILRDQCRTNFLKAYEGSRDGSTLINTYCGIVLPKKIRSAGSKLHLHLFADTDVSSLEFNASFTHAEEYSWRKWPDGNYAIPTPVYGCPEQTLNKWEYGFVNITSEKEQVFPTDNQTDKRSFLLGPYGPYSLQLNFCVKTVDLNHSSDPEPETAEWAQGNYMIYNTGLGCPNGFSESNITTILDDEAWLMRSGPVEDIIEVNQHVIVLHVCTKLNISDTDTLQSDLREPFLVLSPDLQKNQELFEPSDEHSMLTSNSSMEVMVEREGSSPFTDLIIGWSVTPKDLNNVVPMLMAPEGLPALSDQRWALPIPDVTSSTFSDEYYLFDLGQSVLVSGFSFSPNPNDALVDELPRTSPVILLSRRKWDYLQNGAWHCLPYMVTYTIKIDVHCLNEPHVRTVRYVTFTKDHGWLHLLFGLDTGTPWSVWIVSGGASSRCGQDLGMKDGYIEDFQLFEIVPQRPYYPRPGDTGLCSYRAQIDLLRPTTIEGIQVALSSTEGTSTQMIKEIHYFELLFDNKIIVYHKNSALVAQMSIDFSLSHRSGITVFFPYDVTARFVMLEVDTDPPRCYTFELIGCSHSGGKSLQCGGRPMDSTRWFPTKELITRNEMWTRDDSNGTDLLSVNIRCERTLTCMTFVLFDVFGKIDSIQDHVAMTYDTSTTYSYWRKQVEDAESLLVSVRICSSEGNETGGVSSYLTGNSAWEDITSVVLDPGIIVSDGYPFRYKSGALWKWDIFFNLTSNVGLLFYNVSLNKNQERNIPEKFSDKTDRVYIVDNNFDLSLIFSDDLLSTAEGLIAVVDNRFNNMIKQFRTNLQHLNLIWRTVVHDVPRDADAVGFRVFVYASETSTCLPVSDCSMPSANLYSQTVSGSHSNFYEEIWTINSITNRYISLKFDSFDIGCDTETVLELIFDGEARRYCNLNKPIWEIKSPARRLTVMFRFSGIGDTMVEGFSASYSLRARTPTTSSVTYKELTDFIQTESLSEKFNITRVCTPEFNKCYVFLDNLPDLFEDHVISWSFVQASVCERNNWTLVSLHSKLEQEFVGHHFHRIYNHTSSQYAYIGLRQVISTGSFYSYSEWSDGSALTFLWWGKGQPKPQTKRYCTRIPLLVPDNYEWEAIPCNEGVASAAICQHRLEELDYDEDWSHIVEMHESVPEFFDQRDQSSFFVCNNQELISILGHCNSVLDCADGSDEIDCPEVSGACRASEYQCTDGTCVSLDMMCDFYYDCADQSDEECYFPLCDLTAEYQCGNNRCIGKSYFCDGKDDCGDNSDESSCVSPNCNDGTSFPCGFSRCIPLPFVCDGMSDCWNGADEKNCQLPRSCQEWWDAGVRENGIYQIYDAEIECDFDQITTKRTLISKFHHIDYQRFLLGSYFRYANENNLQNILDGNICYQAVDHTCHLWLKKLYDIDWSMQEMKTHPCRCLRYRTLITPTDTSTYTSMIQECEEDDKLTYLPDAFNDADRLRLSKRLESAYRLEFQQRLSTGYLENMKLKLSDDEIPYQFDVNIMKIVVRPIVCYTDFMAEAERVSCGYGYTAAKETRCLYSLDEYNHIRGCRSLKHLQDCGSYDCPVGYFKCPNSYCIEQRYVCDGISQCLDGVDEQGCDTMACVSQYRCLNSSICLPRKYICDGIPHCPLEDDEKLCDFRCPSDCSCRGYSVDCTALTDNLTQPIYLPSSTRMLNSSHNQLAFDNLRLNETNVIFLVHLGVAGCGIANTSILPLDYMYNLVTLDLSSNEISNIESQTFINQKRLKYLYLHDNLALLTISTEAFVGLESLGELMLIGLHIDHISKGAFSELKLSMLSLSGSAVDTFEEDVFEFLAVDKIYLNSTVIGSFPSTLFKGVEDLSLLYTDAYKFCCIKPSYLLDDQCYPHENEFSSCADLMRNEVLRAMLWIIGLLALLGNILSLAYRFIFDRERLKASHGIFVTNLAASDLLMGVYLIIIAGADMRYRGDYIFVDESWRNSALCHFAGILATMSSEASVFIMCFITLDRILVVKYPFGQVRFNQMSANACMAGVWIVSLVISIIPVLFTSYFRGAYYSKSGVCLALPLTRDRPPGWLYAVGIFIVLNLISFSLIAFGQWLIYREIRKSEKSMAHARSARNNDLRVARNLLLVVTTDFLCWFPVGVLGVLALSGIEIKGDAYAWTAVFVLPINSALNPFLYTLSAVLGKKNIGHQSSETSSSSRVGYVTVTKAKLSEYMKIWQQWRFFNKRQQGFLPVKYILMNNQLTVRHCAYITRGICVCLRGLHENKMLQTDFSIGDIYIKEVSEDRILVSLCCRPAVADKPRKTASNIKEFGNILKTLLKESNLEDC